MCRSIGNVVVLLTIAAFSAECYAFSIGAARPLPWQQPRPFSSRSTKKLPFSSDPATIPQTSTDSAQVSQSSLAASKHSAGTTPEGIPPSVDVPPPMADDPTKTPLSTTLLGTILRKLWSPFAFVQRWLFRKITKGIADTLTAIISEPNCNQAFASVIMRGCNMVLTSNRLKERLVAAQATLSKTEPSLAKLTGEDFLRVLAQFVIGLIDPKFNDYNPKESAAIDGGRDGSSPSSSK